MIYQLISGKSGLVSFFLSAIYFFFSVYCFFQVDSINYLFESQILHIIVQQLLAVGCAFIANRLLLQHKLLSIGDYSLFFMLFIVLSSLSISMENTRVLIGLLLVVVLIGRVKSVFNQQNAMVVEFEIGSLAALAYLAHPIFVFVLPYALISILITKANDWRDYLAVITGFGFIILMKASYFVFADRITAIPKILALTFKLKSFEFVRIIDWVLVIVALLLGLFTINYNLKISDKMNIKIRIYYKLWLSLFVFMFAPFLLVYNDLGPIQIALFLAFPLLILIQPFLLKKKKGYVNNVFLVLLIVYCVTASIIQ